MKSWVLGVCLVVTLLLASSTSLFFASAGTPDEWRTRTIYQLLTDRFAQTQGNTQPCNNLQQYCGGTFRGIINHLPYIKGMGFDAIWISPIVVNFPEGYHGYWAKDWFSVNPYFGTAEDLKVLVNTCHKMGIWVLLDVVANHCGCTSNFSDISPFNMPDHYHTECTITNWDNPIEVQLCRLFCLPDLNQTVPYVRQTLLDWVSYLVTTYDFDGIRIDTVPEVSKDFWAEFQKSAGVFAVGEVLNNFADNQNVAYTAPFQSALDGLLNYPLWFALRSVFVDQQSMNILQTVNRESAEAYKDITLLGTFLDNHDQVRFLNVQSDLTLYQNGLIYVLTSTGIPIVYYGTEQGYHGGADPNNRESLWPNYNTTSPLYTLIRTLNTLRNTFALAHTTQQERLCTASFYSYTRGPVFVALTNVGSLASTFNITITDHPYSDGTQLCNIFVTNDCVTVAGGQFTISMVRGQGKVLLPTTTTSLKNPIISVQK